jgi:serine/threonine-protein kinase HipA
VFDGLLPDDEIVRRLIALRVGAASHAGFDLLAALGRDCVGALQFLPEGEQPGPAGAVEGRPLGDVEIGRLLRSLARAPLGVGESSDFRISLAGAQEKTALLHWRGRWHMPQGATATTHILKPAIGRLPSGLDLSPSVENEHLCMRLVAALGLPAARTEIAEFEGVRALVVERFDRLWTRDGARLLRRPQEDCCQALGAPPSRKYEAEGGPGIVAILDLLQGGDRALEDRRLFLKAQIVFWLLGATDGHAKNFSLHLAPGGRYALAPLYDVMSMQPKADAGEPPRNAMKFAMALGDGRHRRFDEIAPRHFRETAARGGVPEATVNDIFEELLAQAPAAFESAVAAMPPGFPEALAASMLRAVRTRLRLLERRPAQAG